MEIYNELIANICIRRTISDLSGTGLKVERSTGDYSPYSVANTLQEAFNASCDLLKKYTGDADKLEALEEILEETAQELFSTNPSYLKEVASEIQEPLLHGDKVVAKEEFKDGTSICRQMENGEFKILAMVPKNESSDIWYFDRRAKHNVEVRSLVKKVLLRNAKDERELRYFLVTGIENENDGSSPTRCAVVVAYDFDDAFRSFKEYFDGVYDTYLYDPLYEVERPEWFDAPRGVWDIDDIDEFLPKN